MQVSTSNTITVRLNEEQAAHIHKALGCAPMDRGITDEEWRTIGELENKLQEHLGLLPK